MDVWRACTTAIALLCCLAQQAGVPAPWYRAGDAWTRELARLRVRIAALPSDVEKTSFLREYVGALVDIGRPDAATRRLQRTVDFTSFDPARFYPAFAADRMPAACGITSFFYVKLVQALGFKAYQYSFGFTEAPHDRFVHSVAFVEVDVGGARRLIVQDPYLDVTYVAPDGAPLDFLDMLRALKTRDYQRVVMRTSAVPTTLLVPDESAYTPLLDPRCRSLFDAALTRSDGTRRDRIPIIRSYDTLMRSPCDGFEAGFEAAMREHGFDEPMLFAFTLRAADVVGSDDSGEMQRRIDAVLGGPAR